MGLTIFKVPNDGGGVKGFPDCSLGSVWKVYVAKGFWCPVKRPCLWWLWKWSGFQNALLPRESEAPGNQEAQSGFGTGERK